MKLDILAIGVHPDDIELSCCGTVLKHIDIGYKVGLLDLTQGELGTRGTPEVRLKEAEDARQAMGALVRENLGMKDGLFKIGENNIKAIARVLRKYQPDIVLANAISDRHTDHGRAADLIRQACFLSGLEKMETEIAGEKQAKWRPKALYHYIQDHNLKPDFVVDISDYLEEKIKVMMCFKSQFYNPDSEESNTPISSQAFLDFIRAKSMTYGRPIGVRYGEGFNVVRDIGVRDMFDLI